jgi:hypothetical protein
MRVLVHDALFCFYRGARAHELAWVVLAACDGEPEPGSFEFPPLHKIS